MQAHTGYHLVSEEIQKQLIDHGWGEMTFKVESLKDDSVKITICSGKSWVFFIKKQIKFDNDNIL